MGNLSEYDKGLKEAVIELTEAIHAANSAQKKLERFGVTSYVLHVDDYGKSDPPRVILRNGLKEMAEIMGVKVHDQRPSWNGKICGIECMTHAVKFTQDTRKEIMHYEPRRKEKAESNAG